MNRRGLLRGSLALAGLGLIAGCGVLPDFAPPRRMPVVGFLSGNSRAAAQSNTEAFQQGLRDLGYAEGRDICVEYRFAEGRDEQLRGLAADLVSLPVSAIFATSAPAALAARAATDRLPIVSLSTDPVALGLVASMARPGGNVTGLSLASTLLAQKKLELLKAVAAGASRVAALWYTPAANAAIQLRELQDAAPRLGLDLRPVGVQDPDDFETAFRLLSAERAEAAFVIGGPEMTARRMRVVEVIHTLRLPSMHDNREWVADGGLLAYGSNQPDLHRRAATYVDKILKGARPADLPVEQPTKFDLVVNLKTAQALGLAIPDAVLQQATEVIR